MDYLIKVVIGIVLIIIGLKVIKYLFFKKTFKFITTIVIVLLLFLGFCYAFGDIGSLKDNKFIQTGAVVADSFADFLKDKADVNAIVKGNKLFKSQKSL